MTTPENDRTPERLDKATSQRLAKLRATPVDISGLKKAIEAQIPRPRRRSRIFARRWLSLHAAAASLLVIGLIVALVIHSSSGPALASPDQLAHIHEEVLVGAGNHNTQVDSVARANVVLGSRWHGAPIIPDLPQGHIMACCMHTIGHKKLVCMSFDVDGVPTTMAVADTADMKIPDSKALTAGGITFHVQSHGDINMVMSHHAGRWVCLMGKLPADRLVGLASSLRF